MSSLRLALKQSLEESGVVAATSNSSSDLNHGSSPLHPGSGDTGAANTSSSGQSLARRSPKHHHHPQPRDHASGKRSAIKAARHNKPNATSRSVDQEGNEGSEQELEGSAFDTRVVSSSPQSHQEGTNLSSSYLITNNAARPHHDSAAHKIQSQWKRKTKKTKHPSESHGELGSDAAHVGDPHDTATGVEPDATEQETASSRRKSAKSQYVPPPSALVLDWVSRMPVKRARRHVQPGLRVKVRFAMAVTKRKGGVDPTTESTRAKTKWFGGRISKVSKEGSKIRIKYDDGTTEVTKFPDPDVVVDNVSNGEHQAPFEKFIPPSITAVSAPARPVHRKVASEAQITSTPDQNPITDWEAPLDGGSVPEPTIDASVAAHPSASSSPSNIMMAATVTASGSEMSPEPIHASPTSNGEKQSKRVRVKPGHLASHAEMDTDDKHPLQLVMTRGKSEDAVEVNHERVGGNGAADGDAGHTVSLHHDQKQSKLKSGGEYVRSSPTLESRSLGDRDENNERPAASGSPTWGIGEASGIPVAKPATTKLTIRIPNRRSDDSSSNATGTEVLPSKSKRRTTDGSNEHLETGGENTEPGNQVHEPTTKRIHIQIPLASVSSGDMTLTQPDSSNDREAGAVDEAGGAKVTEHLSLTERSRPLPFSGRSRSPVPASPRMKKEKVSNLKLVAELTSDAKDILASDSRARAHSRDSSTVSLVAISKEDESGLSKVSSFQEPGSNLVSSSSSAFEDQQEGKSARSSTPEFAGNSTTPLKVMTPRVKKEVDETAPVSRSGRRAAQQANERIVAKGDPGTGEQQPSAPNQPVAVIKKKRKKGDNVDPKDTDDAQWVQCDTCAKWRVVPGNAVRSLPERWYCSDNLWDSKRASCDAPEQTPKQVAKEMRKRKKQRLLALQQAEPGNSLEIDEADGAGESISKDGATDRARSPFPQEEVVKPKREASPVDQLGPLDTSSDSQQKTDRKPLPIKRTKPQESTEVAPASAEVDIKRKPGRPRRANKEVESVSVSASASSRLDDVDNLEWVQCEKCDKWRRLPPHIAADDLPDVWVCDMNTWNTASASCDAPEDKADGLQDTGIFGVSGAKLSYRNLIFGQTGRKMNRPISERTRAAESLFAAPSEDDDSPPTVMYANSSAFVSRARPSSSDESDKMSVFELMSHSNLWAELRGAAQSASGASHGDWGKRLRFVTYDSLPSNMKESLKDMLVHSIDSKTLTGNEVLVEVQHSDWDNMPKDWSAVRPHCSIDLVVTALCELVKEGRLEVVQSLQPNWTLKDWNPKYRCVKSPPSSFEMDLSSSMLGYAEARCTKFAKPWKRNRTQ